MAEYRLFDPDNPPEWLDPEWWEHQPHCNHLESPTGAHVARLHAAAELAAQIAEDQFQVTERGLSHLPVIADLGAGDGALLSLLPESLRSCAFGYEIIRADVEHAREVRGVSVAHANIQTGERFGSRFEHPLPLAPVVVLTEVLEHMADPHGFLTLLRARPEVSHIVASSPWGEAPEKHEPNHAWAWDPKGYMDMFMDAGWDPVGVMRKVEWSQVWAFGRRERPERSTKFMRAAGYSPDDAVSFMGRGG